MKVTKYTSNPFLPTLNRNDFWRPVESVFNDFFNDFFNEDQFVKRVSNSKYPKFNIVEFDDRVEFETQLPGMKKEDINIEITEDAGSHYLRIKGCSKNETKKENEGRVILKELSKSSFSRSFSLSQELDCDIDKIDASFSNGILKLIIKKKEQIEKEKPSIKKVKIN